MPGIQTRLQKSKTTLKVAGRDVMVARKSRQGNSEVRPDAGPAITALERQMLIARAAYIRAEKRGFAPGGELQDWLEAEAEVLRQTGGA